MWACRMFLWFIIYSVIGWIYESTLCSITGRKLVNRGFLNGPLCPIYGFGALIILLVFRTKEVGLLELFLTSAVLTTTLEYMTSYLLEKLFHAKWWDYSKYRFQLNGRICLAGFLVFGALSVLLIKWIHPFIDKQLDKLSQGWMIGLSVILFVLLIADCTVTVISILKLNNKLAEIQEALDRFHREVKQQMDELRKTAAEHRDIERDKVNQLKNRIGEKLENSRFHSDSVEKLLSRPKHQEKRLLRAFPKMISNRHNEALTKLKDRLKK